MAEKSSTSNTPHLAPMTTNDALVKAIRLLTEKLSTMEQCLDAYTGQMGNNSKLFSTVFLDLLFDKHRESLYIPATYDDESIDCDANPQ